eukprot:403347119
MSEIEQEIREKLTASLDIVEIYLEDRSGGCGQSFFCIVVAKDFSGMKLLERQQRVNEILADVIARIHAFELKTWDEKVWADKRSLYIKE